MLIRLFASEHGLSKHNEQKIWVSTFSELINTLPNNIYLEGNLSMRHCLLLTSFPYIKSGGNLYLSEDKVSEAVDAIKKGLEKGKIKDLSQVYLTLGQAYFELQEFEEAKKNFRIAARDKEKKIKTQANNWIKYTENEEIRVKNLALRRDYIQMNSSS